MDEAFVRVAQVGDIAAGQVKVVNVDGQAVGVANVDGHLYAFADVCTHDDGPLAEGELDGGVIVCPRHGARFDLISGAVLSFPAVLPIPVYEVRVEGTDVKVARAPRV